MAYCDFQTGSAFPHPPRRERLSAHRYTLSMKSNLNDGMEQTNSDLVKNSVLYKEFLAEREEILRHKWIESEKAGRDIGFEKALLDWIVKFRSGWREQRRPTLSTPDSRS